MWKSGLSIPEALPRGSSGLGCGEEAKAPKPLTVKNKVEEPGLGE
jgi:hypothetical protein